MCLDSEDGRDWVKQEQGTVLGEDDGCTTRKGARGFKSIYTHGFYAGRRVAYGMENHQCHEGKDPFRA